MKKEWKAPELDVLNVNQTMLGPDGDYTDASFPENTPKDDLSFS